MRTLSNILKITVGSIACMGAIILLTVNYTEQSLLTSIITPLISILLMAIGVQLLLKSSLFIDDDDASVKYNKLMTKYNAVVNDYINEMSENSQLLYNVLEKEAVILRLERQIDTLEREIEEVRGIIMDNSDDTAVEDHLWTGNRE